MSEEKKADLMRTFVGCFESQDIDKALSFCTEDVVWSTPLGTFRGKDEARRYLEWNRENMKDGKFEESGVGILVKGDKASFEHQFTGIIRGEKVEFPAMCTYEFSGDLIKEMRTTFDRLRIAEQASSAWLPKKIVTTLVNTLQKGLD